MSIDSGIFYVALFLGLYFEVYLLYTLIEKRKHYPKPYGDNEYPTVSITVPCFNEEQTLAGTIASLLALDYPHNKLSILIVDDGSTDNTAIIGESLALQHSSVRFIKKKNGGKYTALNIGLKETSSEFVGCLDADSFVDTQALKKMMPHFRDHSVMAVTPAIIVHKPKNILQRMQRVEYNLGIFSKEMLGRVGGIFVTPGPFSIFRTTVFKTIGNYKHAHGTEDMEIAMRMQRHHFKIVNCAEAHVLTVTPDTVVKLYKQRLRWVYGFIKNALDYRDIFFKKKYGELSMIILPFSVVSIITALYFVVLTLKTAVTFISEYYIRFSTIGFSFSPSLPTFELFYVNFEFSQIIALFVVTFLVLMLMLGRKISEGTFKPSVDMIYFLLLYGFLPPLWFGKAVYNTILSKKTPWR